MYGYGNGMYGWMCGTLCWYGDNVCADGGLLFSDVFGEVDEYDGDDGTDSDVVGEVFMSKVGVVCCLVVSGWRSVNVCCSFRSVGVAWEYTPIGCPGGKNGLGAIGAGDPCNIGW